MDLTIYQKNPFIIMEPSVSSFYYNIINQLQPKSILDVGMFLNRAGMISRSSSTRALDDNIALTGISFLEHPLPVYHTIYNQIFYYPTYFQEEALTAPSYDLTVFLSLPDLENRQTLLSLFERTLPNTAYYFTDDTIFKNDSDKKDRYFTESVYVCESRTYYLIKNHRQSSVLSQEIGRRQSE